MSIYFLSGRKRDKKFRNYHFSPDHIMSCCNCLFSFKSIVHCTFTLKCFFYHICIWLRNEWWSFKIFVVEHFQSVWWWKARKNRLRIIYFMEEILRTLKLQKSTTLSAMAEKEERKEKHTESKRIQQICSFRFGFFLLFQLCVPFRFYASTKFMSINYEYVFISFSSSFCPFYSHTYFIGPSFSSVAVLSSNEVKQFCFCCSKSNINFIENASRRMNERKSRRHNKIRFTKQASNLICFAEMLNDSK